MSLSRASTNGEQGTFKMNARIGRKRLQAHSTSYIDELLIRYNRHSHEDASRKEVKRY